jgi:carboxyl-terminal processing protease
MSPILKYFTTLIVALAIAVAAFAGGVIFGTAKGDSIPVPSITDASTSDVSDVVDEVERLIDRQALEPADEDSKTAGAVQGLLDSMGDPYASYFDADHFEYFSEMTDGEFYGIGVNVTERDGKAVIVSPIEGTPAFEVGLQAEDEIVTVDGYDGEPWDLDDVVARIRGEEGTDVVLGIRRPNGEDELLEVTITRAKIDIPNVMDELVEGDVGYIRLLQFNEKTEDALSESIDQLADEGAEGYILDLRDNPGGLLDVSVDVVSLFVEDGVVVKVEDREGLLEEYQTTGRVATDAPLVVLVNENSASASEIVAGALQDYDRATVVGVTTFGKGSVQTVEPLSTGDAVKFTTARYLTPEGRSIHKVGVEPDVVVEMSPKDQVEREDDVQFAEAVAALKGLL